MLRPTRLRLCDVFTPTSNEIIETRQVQCCDRPPTHAISVLTRDVTEGLLDLMPVFTVRQVTKHNLSTPGYLDSVLFIL